MSEDLAGYAEQVDVLSNIVQDFELALDDEDPEGAKQALQKLEEKARALRVDLGDVSLPEGLDD